MTDFNNPTNTTDKTDLMTEIKDRDLSIGKMDFSSDTNVPDDMIRFNAATPAFDKKNGGSWDQIFGAGEIDHNSLLNYDANEHADITEAETVSGIWNFSAGITADNLIFTNATSDILSDSSDASDTKQIRMGGGGAISSSRGAYLRLAGNENANAGSFEVYSGGVSGGNILLHGSHSSSEIRMRPGNDQGVRLLRESSYANLLMGSAVETEKSGLIQLGGQRLQMTTSYQTLAEISFETQQQVSGLAVFNFTKDGLADCASEVYFFSFQKHDASTPVGSSSSLSSYNSGSVPADFRIVATTTLLRFQARNSSGVGTYDGNVAIFACTLEP